jgi:hypothetical protein
MKNVLTILALMFCAGTVQACGNETDELHLSLALSTGERSKDSSSQTTTITIERGAIVLERTSSGRGHEAAALPRKFRLSPADKMKLINLIRANNLLLTDAVELPRQGPTFYFEILLDLNLDGKKGVIKISAPRNAVTLNDVKLYQNTLAVVKELYRIINSQDKRIVFEELIRPPR